MGWQSGALKTQGFGSCLSARVESVCSKYFLMRIHSSCLDLGFENWRFLRFPGLPETTQWTAKGIPE